MDGFAGDVARVAYYFRPIEDAIAGIVAGVTTAKAVQATGKVPYGDVDGSSRFNVKLENYKANESVYNNPKYFDQLTGNEIWPENGGVLKGTLKVDQTISSNKILARWGSENGSYFTTYGTSSEQLSLSPRTNLGQYANYKTLKNIEGVETGIAAPWFDKPGGGWQGKTPMSAQELLRKGYIEQVIK